jgi:DNA polymerase I-like protein with 3'-5' exonuclease and polymerase domains
MTKVLLIDGNALLYRAYHAFPKELTTPSGLPSGAIYGFTRILLSTIKYLNPEEVAVSFDLAAPSFRKELFPEYKANRQKMPDDLQVQIETTHQLVELLEIPIYAVEGFEADDCLGSIARQVSEQNKQAIIVSGDQDLLQLVDQNILVFSPGKTIAESVLYTPAKVIQKYGFTPKQMLDYKALRGDPSDNIPGVSGIGEIGAKELIQQFQSLENLYSNLDQVTKPTLKAKLETGKAMAFLSYNLATIDQAAPVTYLAKECELKLEHPRKLTSFLQSLGFKSLLQELPASHKLVSQAAEIFAPAESDTSESLLIDSKLAPVLRQMEETGAKIDRPYLKQLEKEFTQDIQKIQAKIYLLAGENFNLDSPSQISHIFYENLAMPTKGIKKRKSFFSTDAQSLTKLSLEYPIAKLLLSYRELSKLNSTYVLPLQTLADTKSRVHTSYAPDTTTGRLSSKNPNLQNIPIRTEQGRRIRHAFVADLQKILISADYSQIELRVAAALSADSAMQKIFQAGGDFHQETAEKMQVDRRVAKIINFSILYGKGAFGFAEDMQISVSEAQKYIDNYFQTFPQLRVYLDQIIKDGENNGYLETLFGRRKYFPNLKASQYLLRNAAKREALNYPIQGTAADILKLAMLKVDQNLNGLGKLILTVHDELIVETPLENQDQVKQILKQNMEQAVKLSVPLKVKIAVGQNWGELND